MSNMQVKAKRVWHVCYTHRDSRGYYGGETKRVIAETMEDAIAKIKESEPNVIFVSVNHHGMIDHE